MHQIKMFKGLENEVAEMEQRINDWLRESGARVLSVTGNIASQSPKAEAAASLGQGGFPPSDVLVILTYETPG